MSRMRSNELVSSTKGASRQGQARAGADRLCPESRTSLESCEPHVTFGGAATRSHSRRRTVGIRLRRDTDTCKARLRRAVSPVPSCSRLVERGRSRTRGVRAITSAVTALERPSCRLPAPARSQQAPHFRKEQIGIARLSQEAGAPGFARALAVFGGGMRRERHDRDSSCLRVLLQL